MDKREASKLLQVTAEAGPTEIAEAFRAAVKRAHPDYGGDGDVGKLRKAKQELTRRAKAAQRAQRCGSCNGTGKLGPNKRGAKMRCLKCNGTGVTRREW